MHSKREPLPLLIVVAAVPAALTDALLTWLGSPGQLQTVSRLLAVAGDFLIALATLILVGIGAQRIARKLIDESTISDFLSFPWIWLAAAWRRSPEDMSLRAAWSRLLGLVIACGLLTALAFIVMIRFHEPSRMAALIGASGIFAVLLGYRLGSAVPSIVARLPVLEKGNYSSWLGRLSVILFTGVPCLALAFVIISADELFGAVKVGIFLTLLVFIAALSAGAALKEAIVGKIRLKPRWFVISAPFAIVLGLALLSGSPMARLSFHEGSALGKPVVKAISRALDMDNDGYAWLIGNDCHPLDPKSNPLAKEIPGNDYDENCDGLDTIPDGDKYKDPLPVDSSQAKQFKKRKKRKGNVLFIIIDALRADHVPIYGYKRNTMPSLSAFGAKTTVFDNFFAVGNHTALSMPSIFTGYFPHEFPKVLKVNWHSSRIRRAFNPMPSRMRRLGYETVYFAGHFMSAFLTGWETIKKPSGKGHEKAVFLAKRTLRALKRIGGTPRAPHLVGLHFMDPHHPYEPGSRPHRFGTDNIDLYDAEVAHVDESLLPILNLMSTPGYSDWLIIITSDHGEGLLDHGIHHHGHTLYDLEIHVPFIIRVPGVKAQRISMAAGHLDILPTILHWIGRRVPPDLPGRSLLPLIASPEKFSSRRRIVFAESFRDSVRFGAFDGRYSMLHQPNLDIWELYDREADPKQLKNIFDSVSLPILHEALSAHVEHAMQDLAADKPSTKKKPK